MIAVLRASLAKTSPPTVSVSVNKHACLLNLFRLYIISELTRDKLSDGQRARPF